MSFRTASLHRTFSQYARHIFSNVHDIPWRQARVWHAPGPRGSCSDWQGLPLRRRPINNCIYLENKRSTYCSLQQRDPGPSWRGWSGRRRTQQQFGRYDHDGHGGGRRAACYELVYGRNSGQLLASRVRFYRCRVHHLRMQRVGMNDERMRRFGGGGGALYGGEGARDVMAWPHRDKRTRSDRDAPALYCNVCSVNIIEVNVLWSVPPPSITTALPVSTRLRRTWLHRADTSSATRTMDKLKRISTQEAVLYYTCTIRSEKCNMRDKGRHTEPRNIL